MSSALAPARGARRSSNPGLGDRALLAIMVAFALVFVVGVVVVVQGLWTVSAPDGAAGDDVAVVASR
ncbi:hypothetical protein ACQCX5_00400 [Propionibacteriaceae bacterium G57]|uniref:hypothetical protein n=1 Tax=Aestuariimicrobium sp. G57 TaxID=3418485 RepID=UPI003DA7830D